MNHDLKKPIVYCDIDGVVADLNHEWLRRYNEEYNDNLTKDKITAWGMTEFVKPECGVDIYKYLRMQDLYHHVPVMPGALDGVEWLRDAGFRVVFATSSNPDMMGLKLHWLAEHGFLKTQLGFPHPDYIEIHSKYLLRGAALIDDAPHNLEFFEGYRFLFDQHHNQQADPGYHRVFGWDHDPIVKIIETLYTK